MLMEEDKLRRKLKPQELEENTVVLNFLIKCKKEKKHHIAYTIEEMREQLKLPSLSDIQISREKDIRSIKYKDGKTYYFYETLEMQLKELLERMAKEGKIKKTVVGGIDKYEAI